MRVLHETLSWEESSEQEGEGLDESLACLMTWIQWLEVRKTRKRKRENNRQRKTCELEPQDTVVLRLKFGRNFRRNRLPFPRSCLHFVLKKLDSQVRFSSSDIIVCFLSSMNPVDEPTQLSGFRTSLFLSSKSRDTHLVTSACALSNESEESCLQNSSLCHMFSLPDTSTSELLFPWNSREKRFSDQQRDQINTFFSSHLNLHFNWLHTKNDWQENVLFHCNCKIPARKFPERRSLIIRSIGSQDSHCTVIVVITVNLWKSTSKTWNCRPNSSRQELLFLLVWLLKERTLLYMLYLLSLKSLKRLKNKLPPSSSSRVLQTSFFRQDITTWQGKEDDQTILFRQTSFLPFSSRRKSWRL